MLPVRRRLYAARERLQYWPDEPGAFVFELFATVGLFFLHLPMVGAGLKSIGQILSIGIEAIAPAIPIDIRSYNSFSKDPFQFYWNILKYCAPLTIFFCYIMNAILTFYSGTLLGSVSGRMYFLTDFYNLILYLFVCPIYVSTSICLIVITVLSWHKLNSHYTSLSKWKGSSAGYFSASTRVAGFVAISLLIAGLYISNYIDDLADPKKTGTLYWFFDEPVPGIRILNKDGYYYTMMNAFLLFITSMAAFCYIAISIEMFKLGKHLESTDFAVKFDRRKPTPDIVDEQERRLIITLSDFAYSYVMAKILVLAYAINILIWQISPAGRVANMHSAIIALLIIGLFFLVIPSLYLNRRWHLQKVQYAISARHNHSKEAQQVAEYSNLRPQQYRRVGMLLDMASAFFLVFILKVQYDFTDILDYLSYLWKEAWFGH